MKIYNPAKTSFIDQIVISHLREAAMKPGGFDVKTRTQEPASEETVEDVHLRSLRW